MKKREFVLNNIITACIVVAGGIFLQIPYMNISYVFGVSVGFVLNIIIYVVWLREK